MPMGFQNLEVEIQGPVATVWLNRPAVRNALDEVLLSEITQAVNRLEQDDAVRVLVLGGRGKVFCAGADLNWMKRMAGYGDEQNQADAMGLATMLKTLYRVPISWNCRALSRHSTAFGTRWQTFISVWCSVTSASGSPYKPRARRCNLPAWGKRIRSCGDQPCSRTSAALSMRRWRASSRMWSDWFMGGGFNILITYFQVMRISIKKGHWLPHSSPVRRIVGVA